MDMINAWIDMLVRQHHVQDLRELPVYVVKAEIAEVKDAVENEKVFLAGGSPQAKENIKNMKAYIKILKGVLEL
jgi:hypothetical protein